MGGAYMKIGYACLTMGLPDYGFKSCTLKNTDNHSLTQIISHNLTILSKILDYNEKNSITMFRITSDLIPFASSPANKLIWWNLFKDRFTDIGKQVMRANMRVSMHPGQYTVLNAIDEKIVERAIEDLEYHTKVLDCMGLSSEHKIILHIGGVYGDKTSAIKRFSDNYQRLKETIKKRLIIENDDRSYTIEEVLRIGIQLGIPVVFDNLHNEVNASITSKTEQEWIIECQKTWKDRDGIQKIHYSQQNPNKQKGSHTESIHIEKFVQFYEKLPDKNINIMLEVKDKNLSALKCINTTLLSDIKLLEEEWARYKYFVLEKSPNIYGQIRQLLKDKKKYPAIGFYQLIEESFNCEKNSGYVVNAAQHIWGYFSKVADTKEKEQFTKNINAYIEGTLSVKILKKRLLKLALKYKNDYLLDSYYFYL